MKKITFFIALSILIIGYATTAQAQTKRYVQQGATGTGTSWANASPDLQAMLNASAAGDSVWVATGTYLPTHDAFGNASPSDPRDKTFYIKDGVHLYGRFSGTETYLAQRDFSSIATVTVLSGDIGGIYINTDNAYHVAVAAPNSSGVGVTVDGFSITDGFADGSGSITINGNTLFRNYAGGIALFYGTNTLKNNAIFANISLNTAGGVWLNYGTNTLTNNMIFSNEAYIGGAIHASFGTYTITDNKFLSNRAEGYGGAIYLDRNTATLRNNHFANNYADNSGGAIFAFGGFYTITRNTIIDNSSINGGGICVSTNATTLSNNTISNNVIVNNTAYNKGGGIWVHRGINNKITNNTIVNNTATNNGGALATLYLGANEKSVMTNNIFWDNKKGTSATVQGADFYNENINATDNTFENNIFQMPASNYSGNYYSIPYPGSNLFATNPLFLNMADLDGADNIHRTADDGLTLTNCSPAYNTGYTATTTDDILGTMRPQFGAYDIGAYESATALYPNILPIITGESSICPNSTITLTATGGVSYAWSNESTTPTTNITAVGTYTVTATGAGGCTGSATYDVYASSECCNLVVTDIRYTLSSSSRTLVFNTPTITGVLSGSTLTYFWEFGDGTTATTSNASKTYTAAGTYTVCCTVTAISPNGLICRYQCCRTVNVGDPCAAANPKFNYTYNSATGAFVFAGNTNTAYNSFYTITNESGTVIATSPVVANNTAHSFTYTNLALPAGTYTVCRTISRTLNATNGDICAFKFCRNLLISPSTCGTLARFTAVVRTATPLLVAFNSAASVSTTTTEWSFATTSTGAYTVIGTTATLNYTFPNYATYWVKLIANKGTSCEQSVIHRIELGEPSCATVPPAQTRLSNTNDSQTLTSDATIVPAFDDESYPVIQPNPTNGVFNIMLNRLSEQAVTINVVNLQGALLDTQKTANGTASLDIDLSKYPSGLYLVTMLSANGERITQKVVKE